MTRSRAPWAILPFLVLTALAAGPASLEGRWVLVEQGYERGEANMADLSVPVILEILPAGGGMTATMRAGSGAAEPIAWPAMVADAGPMPVQVLERVLDPVAGRVRAHYRVDPSPADDLVLDVVESYTLDTETGDLAGTVTVTFTVGEDERGSFVLRRRFERAER